MNQEKEPLTELEFIDEDDMKSKNIIEPKNVYIDERTGKTKTLTKAITDRWVSEYWGMPMSKINRILDKAIEKDKSKKRNGYGWLEL